MGRERCGRAAPLVPDLGVPDVREAAFETLGHECGGCGNDCEIVLAVRDGEPIDAWGNRRAKGLERAKASVAEEADEEPELAAV